mgnify:CR=1 FL=1
MTRFETLTGMLPHMVATILIADDDPIIRLDLKQMLQNLGYEVVAEAGDGPAVGRRAGEAGGMTGMGIRRWPGVRTGEGVRRQEGSRMPLEHGSVCALASRAGVPAAVSRARGWAGGES